MSKPFWENSTRTRYFAELFETHVHDSINAATLYNKTQFHENI